MAGGTHYENDWTRSDEERRGAAVPWIPGMLGRIMKKLMKMMKRRRTGNRLHAEPNKGKIQVPAPKVIIGRLCLMRSSHSSDPLLFPALVPLLGSLGGDDVLRSGLVSS
jgi:hypothetical protein